MHRHIGTSPRVHFGELHVPVMQPAEPDYGEPLVPLWAGISPPLSDEKLWRVSLVHLGRPVR